MGPFAPLAGGRGQTGRVPTDAPDRPTPPWALTATRLISERGLRRAEVADALGLSPRGLADRLAGRTRPFTGELKALARLLGMEVAELLAAQLDAPGRPAPPDLALLTDRDRRTYQAQSRVPLGPALGTVRATQAYVDDTLAGDWWASWAPEVTEVVVDGCGRATHEVPAWHSRVADGDGHRYAVHLPRWARRPVVVLHELAHVAAGPLLAARAHGPQFARLWVDLVAERMGPEAAARLAGELRAEGLGLAARAEVARARRQGRREMARLMGRGVGGRQAG